MDPITNTVEAIKQLSTEHFGCDPRQLDVREKFETIGNTMKNMAWAYIDNIYPKKKKLLVRMGRNGQSEWDFIKFCVEHVDRFQFLGPDFKQSFQSYDNSLDRCGVVILDPSRTKALVVKNRWGTYGCPKGKISREKRESSFQAALRETKEETSFDPLPYTMETDYFTLKDDRKPHLTNHFYVAFNVSEKTVFRPMFRGEVYGFHWCSIANPDVVLTNLTASLFTFLQKIFLKNMKEERFIDHSLLARHSNIVFKTPPSWEVLDTLVDLKKYQKQFKEQFEKEMKKINKQ
eukprot:m.167434 g.167434  ORF g.167434 m.167434 type:complete len:290 (-) comp13464_c0_seq4:135-1004(-)